MLIRKLTIALCGVLLPLGCSDSKNSSDGGATMAHTLFVAHAGSLLSYDIGTGQERNGQVANVSGPTDMQSLSNGTMLVNLTDGNQILGVQGKDMLEAARMPSSASGGTRPVHSYISPVRNGKQYWLSLNDGMGGIAATSSARFVDVVPTSATYLQAVGEVNLGVGHHKAAFSSTTERVAISNISDCSDIITVFDYSDIRNIRRLGTLTAAQAGYDGSTPAKTCQPNFSSTGQPASPHGIATSKVSRKAYNNITGDGDIAIVNIDASPPTFNILHTHGTGAGYTKSSIDGRYVFSLQSTPREYNQFGPRGPTCQIGQLVVIEASSDTIARELPLLYKGPGCTATLTGTDEQGAEPGHSMITGDGKTLFITLAGKFGDDMARVRQEIVVDITNPASPVQLLSIPTGASTSHAGDAMTGDDKFVFVANNIDGTVTQINVATRMVVKTITVRAKPQTIATYGSVEGPSHQTGIIY